MIKNVKIIILYSNHFNKIDKFFPFLLAKLNRFFDCLKLFQAGKDMLNIFSLFLGQDHKDGIIKLQKIIPINESGSIGQILQPFIGKHDLRIPHCPIFDIKLINHISQFFTSKIVEWLFGVPNPPLFFGKLQESNKIDELDKSLVAH